MDASTATNGLVYVGGVTTVAGNMSYTRSVAPGRQASLGGFPLLVLEGPTTYAMTLAKFYTSFPVTLASLVASQIVVANQSAGVLTLADIGVLLTVSP